MPEPLLIVRGVEAGYRNRQILFGVDLDVGEGEAGVLLGANCSGKSTLLSGGTARLLERVYQSFPRLAERRTQPVHLTSGGERRW